MPEGSRNNETNPAGSTEVDKLAEKIGGAVASNFTEEQAAALNTPAMQAKLEQWQDAGHLDNGAFISQLAAIAQEKADADAVYSAPLRRPRRETTSSVETSTRKERVLNRIKKMGRAGALGAIAGGVIVTGLGATNLFEDNGEQTSYILADVDAHTVAPNATEAEMIAFFNLTPTTHDQTKETPDTRDDFNFRPTREALFSYDGSEESVQLIMDDMSDMFRRDVRVQAAWASALKADGAPQVPTTTEMQDEGIYYNYHHELYKFTDRLARDVKLRTAVYNDMMNTLKNARWADQIHEATSDQISVQHDGTRVSVAKRVGDRGREAQYIPIEGQSLKGEKVNVMYKIDCGQWMLIAGNIEIPMPDIIDQPREVVIPPTVTETPPPPVTTPPPETTTPPRTTQPPRTNPPRTTLAPKRAADIPPAPVPVQGHAPRIDVPAAPPPPPPPAVYQPPAFQMPDLGDLIRGLAPGARPSTGTWERGQGSAPSIPRNNNTNPGGGSGMNSGMVGE